MKKIDKSISKGYLPLRIHLGDLESIEDVFKQGSKSVTFATKDYQYESVEELHNNVKTDRLRELHIKATDPYVTIDLEPSWARVYVSSSEPSSAGIFYQLDQIISAKTRTLKLLYSWYFVWTLNVFLWLTNGIYFIPSVKSSRIFSLVPTLLTILISICLVWILYVRLRSHSVILMFHAGSEKSFFQRNKDNIILVFISALLGAALGVAGTLMVNYLQRK